MSSVFAASDVATGAAEELELIADTPVGSTLFSAAVLFGASVEDAGAEVAATDDCSSGEVPFDVAALLVGSAVSCSSVGVPSGFSGMEEASGVSEFSVVPAFSDVFGDPP